MKPTLIETKHQGEAMASDDSSTIAHGRATGDATLEFGRFRLLLRQRQLMADGARIELGARAFELLLALIEAEGLLLTKDALMVRVWPGIVVAPENLKVQIAALRKALGESRDFIRTEFGRGYRFAATVRRSSIAEPEALPGTGGTGASVGGNAALPLQVAAIVTQLACLEDKLAQALQRLDDTAQRKAAPFHRHAHWVTFSSRTKERGSGKGVEAGKMAFIARNG
jgi:DNA-binding winged helix-turn-helix (wHTH) protein